jgi:hypothetical protein
MALPAALVRHRLFERLVASKAWIGLVAFALIGIVTLQLALLELNGGIGRALAREEALQRQNAALAVANSELSAGERVYGQAAKLGMAPVPAGVLRSLAVHPGDAQHAAGALATPVRPSSEGSGEAGGEHASESGAAAAAAPGAGSEGASAGGGEAASSSPPEGSQGEAAAGSASTAQATPSQQAPPAAQQGGSGGEAGASGGAAAEGSASGSG